MNRSGSERFALAVAAALTAWDTLADDPVRSGAVALLAPELADALRTASAEIDEMTADEMITTDGSAPGERGTS